MLRLVPVAGVPFELFKPLHSDPEASVRLQYVLQVPFAISSLDEADPFLFAATVERLIPLSGLFLHAEELNVPKVETSRRALGMALALRRSGNPKDREKALELILNHPDPAVRRLGMQWIAEENLLDYAKLLPRAAAQPPVTPELFEAYLAAQEILAGKKRDDTSGDEFVLRVLDDAAQPAAFHALALRMVRPDHPKLPTNRLATFLKNGDGTLRHESAAKLGRAQRCRLSRAATASGREGRPDVAGRRRGRPGALREPGGDAATAPVVAG